MGVIRGPARKLAGATRLALWIGTGTGLVLVGISGGDPRGLQAVDNIGTLLFLGCGGVLLVRWVKRLAAGRPVRDDILAQRVTRAESRITGHDQKFAALTEVMAEAASEAGVAVPDNDETAPIPHLRIVRDRPRRAAQLCADVFPVPPAFLFPLDAGAAFADGLDEGSGCRTLCRG